MQGGRHALVAHQVLPGRRIAPRLMHRPASARRARAPRQQGAQQRARAAIAHANPARPGRPRRGLLCAIKSAIRLQESAGRALSPCVARVQMDQDQLETSDQLASAGLAAAAAAAAAPRPPPAVSGPAWAAQGRAVGRRQRAGAGRRTPACAAEAVARRLRQQGPALDHSVAEKRA